MRKFDTKVQYLKYKVLREVARLAWDDKLLENVIDIPKKQINCYRGTYKGSYMKTNRPFTFKVLEKINLNKLLPLTTEQFYQ